MTVHILNLRDVGGLPAADGSVRSGRLLRSGLPHHGDRTPDGLAWPPSVVLDLRSPAEHRAEHPLSTVASRLVNLPLLDALRPDRQRSETLVELYRVVLEDAAAMLVEVVHEIAAADGPVLVHCAAGKDRTGIAVALVLRLLGVSRDDVHLDYALTEHAHAAIDHRLRGLSTEPPPYPAAFLLVAPDALDGVLDVWDAHPDGVEGWYLGAGGDAAQLTTLRRELIGVGPVR